MVMEDTVTQSIHEKFLVLERVLDERAKRLWAGTEARSPGRGGVTRVSKATKMTEMTEMSRSCIHAGLREIESAGTGGMEATGRQRTRGEGRKRLKETDTSAGTPPDQTSGSPPDSGRDPAPCP